MSFLYVDSSALVAVALDAGRYGTAWRRAIKQVRRVGTSEIAVVECQAGFESQLRKRPQDRVHAEGMLNQLLGGLRVFSVGSIVLGTARALVRRHRVALGLRSLDAIHLATAELLRREVVAAGETGDVRYLTADRKQHEAFVAEGFSGELLV